MTTSSHPRWSIWGFYKKAWHITWNNKKLWVLGAALTIYTQGNFNYRSSGDRVEREMEDRQQVEASTVSQVSPLSSPQTPSFYTYSPKEEQNKLNTVNENIFEDSFDWNDYNKLADEVPFFGALRDTYQAIPFYVKALFVLEVLALLALIIVIPVIGISWANAALLTGVRDAAHNKLGSLAEVSKEGLRHLKAFVWLAIVPTLILIGALLGGGLVLALALTILFGIMPLLGILVIIGAIIVAVYGLMRFIAAVSWASRYVVNDKVSGSEAYKRGNALGSKTMWKVLRLGSVNIITYWIVMAILFSPGLFLITRSIMLASSLDTEPTFSAFIPGAIFLLIAMSLSSLASVLFNVFNAATFQLGFESVSHLRPTTKEQE